MQKTKVLVLWPHITGYLSSSLRALAGEGMEILLVAYHPSDSAPFSLKMMDWIPESNKIFFTERGLLTLQDQALINNFNPNILLCGGWSNHQFIKISKSLHKSCFKVITFDTQLSHSFRQILGRIWFKFELLKIFNCAFVPGDRQFRTAIFFGFQEKNILMGSYAPDKNTAPPVNHELIASNKKFIFVGRLVAEKGIDFLAEAYKIYRKKSDSPWPLYVAGVGPLGDLLNIDGVVLLGFMEPRMLFEEMRSAGCLIAPSSFEPWGLQIAEAASLGLPIIATSACGSAVHLVRSDFNGHLISPKDSEGLVQAMFEISTVDNLVEFSRNSYSLSGQYTPSIWAKTLSRAYSKFKNV
jgi:glycosyltransferase involved in cell wall biosynthesis